MRILNLGKLINNKNEKSTAKSADHQTILEKNGSLISIVCSKSQDSYALAKTIAEDFFLQEDDVYTIDVNGYLTSLGLTFDPENSDEIALTIPYKEGEFPELRALEYSAKIREELVSFNDMEHFNNYKNNLVFFLLYEGFQGHRAVYNTPFSLNFFKSKDLAQEYFTFYANFLNETSNSAIVNKDINLIKYLVGAILKKKIKIESINDLFGILESFRTMSGKLNISEKEFNKFIEKAKKRFTKHRDFLFSGLEISTDLMANLAKFHNVTSFYISDKFDIYYKELESFIILKKLLNLSISNYNKSMVIIIDFIKMPNLLSKFINNLDILTNYKNINWVIVVDPKQENTISILLEKSNILYHKGIKNRDDISFISGNNIYGEKIGSKERFFAKRVEFSITKSITSMDIPKMKMAKEFYELIGQNKTEKTKEIYKMIVKSGPLTGKEILLTSDEIVFGRNEFFPSNKLISRRHFKLVFDGNNYFIIDTSVNGTFLNIQKINKSVLSDKDKIILGNNEVELLFRKE